jgi:hypothetical protein
MGHMDLGQYVEALHHELLTTAAAGGGEETRALAQRLFAPLDSAVRLTLLNVLSAAADEITRDLAPGSVDLRLRGMEPSFVVTPPPVDDVDDDFTRSVPDETGAGASAMTHGATDGATNGATARINFRPPQVLKDQIEEAASRQGVSVNAWLVRASAAALQAENGQAPQRKQRFNGWVQS